MCACACVRIRVLLASQLKPCCFLLSPCSCMARNVRPRLDASDSSAAQPDAIVSNEWGIPEQQPDTACVHVTVIDLCGVHKTALVDDNRTVEWAKDDVLSKCTDIPRKHWHCVRVQCARSGHMLGPHCLVRHLVVRGQVLWCLRVVILLEDNWIMLQLDGPSANSTNATRLSKAIKSAKQRERRARKELNRRIKELTAERQRHVNRLTMLRADYTSSENDSAASTPSSYHDGCSVSDGCSVAS